MGMTNPQFAAYDTMKNAVIAALQQQCNQQEKELERLRDLALVTRVSNSPARVPVVNVVYGKCNVGGAYAEIEGNVGEPLISRMRTGRDHYSAIGELCLTNRSLLERCAVRFDQGRFKRIAKDETSQKAESAT